MGISTGMYSAPFNLHLGTQRVPCSLRIVFVEFELLNFTSTSRVLKTVTCFFFYCFDIRRSLHINKI